MTRPHSSCHNVENRERFFQRLTPILSSEELLDIQLAYTLAKFGHRAQVRRETDPAGRPLRYFEHCRRTAIVLIDFVGIVRSDLIAASLLHDTKEDTKDVTPELIRHSLGDDVDMIVRVVSKVPPEGYLDRFWQCSDWRPYIVKGCDRLDNLRSLGPCESEFQSKQLTETIEHYYPLFDRMVELTPEQYRPGAVRLRDEIHRTTEGIADQLAIGVSTIDDENDG